MISSCLRVKKRRRENLKGLKTKALNAVVVGLKGKRRREHNYPSRERQLKKDVK